MQQLPYRASLALVVAVFITGCGDATESSNDDGASTPSVPWPVTAFPSLPDIMDGVPEARIELGTVLFYDPILSVDRETACATCHSELWGMGDALPVSIGHGAGILAGPGRKGPNVLRRNAPTLYNLAFRATFFLDGRAKSLEAQAITPMVADDEMNRDPAEAVVEIAGIPEYADLFAEAFPDDPRVTVDNLASALAAFQRTLVSNRSLYDAYLKGDLGALRDDVVEGMFRFAEMGCDSCHAPPLFESEIFADRNVSAAEGIVDEGRAEVTGDAEDIGTFRTPTLRNIAFTAPYYHNGSVVELDDVVRNELAQTGLPYTDEDAGLITLFIDEALRDESREPERPDFLPSGLSVPLDGTGIRR